MVDLDAAAAVVIARAELTDDAPGRFGMAMIALGADDAAEFITGIPGWLELSVVNGPESVVVSGEWAAVQQILERAARRGCSPASSRCATRRTPASWNRCATG